MVSYNHRMVHFGSLGCNYNVKAQLLGHMSASRVELNCWPFPRATGNILLAAMYVTRGKDIIHDHYYKLSKSKVTKIFEDLNWALSGNYTLKVLQNKL